jgi:IS5 family transposase
VLYLQHSHDCSDEVAVNTWVESPYWQHCTGETYFQTEAPRLAAQIGRYAHAKQYRRMKKSVRTLRSRVGRVMRDVGRQLERIDPSRQ